MIEEGEVMKVEFNEKNAKIEGNNLIIELTETIKNSLRIQSKPLCEFNVGDEIIDDSGKKWYVVEQDFENNRTKVWMKNISYNRRCVFDRETNDFSKSKIKEWLNDENGEVLRDIYKGFGKENVLVDEVDLWSLNGNGTYGKCKCKVHLGTFDDYRKAKKNGMFLIATGTDDDPFWLDTPAAANIRDESEEWHSNGVTIVNIKGGVGVDYNTSKNGIRPFLTLNSATVISYRCNVQWL